MKKLLVLMGLMMPVVMAAQPYYDGVKSFSAGIGIGNTFYDGKYYHMVTPGITLAYDHGAVYVPMGADVDGLLGFGVMAGWSAARYEYPTWGDDLWINYNGIMLAARANYFFLFSDKFVPYAGLLVGYNISLHSWGGDAIPFQEYDFRDSGLALGALGGGRWYFNESVALFGEVGWGVNILTIGAAFNIY